MVISERRSDTDRAFRRLLGSDDLVRPLWFVLEVKHEREDVIDRPLDHHVLLESNHPESPPHTKCPLKLAADIERVGEVLITA